MVMEFITISQRVKDFEDFLEVLEEIRDLNDSDILLELFIHEKIMNLKSEIQKNEKYLNKGGVNKL